MNKINFTQYRDALRDHTVIPVLQGESRVSDDSRTVMTTLLGSCVSACIWDPEARLGGMNHFLLPGCEKSPDGALAYGVQAMEVLVNALIRGGASRSRLKVKLLGGAKMRDGGPDIGAENVNFAKWYVENEGFDLLDCCLGGRQGRNIRFWPVGGRIQRRFMVNARSTPQIEIDPFDPDASNEQDLRGGDVQLF